MYWFRLPKVSPKINDDPRSNMKTQNPKSKIPKSNNPKPISGYNATRNTKLSRSIVTQGGQYQAPKPKPCQTMPNPENYY